MHRWCLLCAECCPTCTGGACSAQSGVCPSMQWCLLCAECCPSVHEPATTLCRHLPSVPEPATTLRRHQPPVPEPATLMHGGVPEDHARAQREQKVAECSTLPSPWLDSGNTAKNDATMCSTVLPRIGMSAGNIKKLTPEESEDMLRPREKLWEGGPV